MDITIDRRAVAPVYRQIAEQIKLHISSGRLPASSRLPTVRKLATDLEVTRLTVQNAYAELQTGGWTESTVGRGTFVSAHTQPSIMRHSAEADITPDGYINDLLQVGAAVGLRSLASASPDPRLFPAEEFMTPFAGNAFAHNGSAHNGSELAGLFQYSAAEGDPALRAATADFLRERELFVDPDDILIVAGATQGLSLATRLLCRPGDAVLVEEPTYLGMLHTLRTHGAQIIGMPLLPDGGMDLDHLERLVIQVRPRFLYTVPTFQNPSGTSLPSDQRIALLHLAEKHGFLIVEDDIYARLSYEKPVPRALRTLDGGSNVLHIGSFSKLFAPGLRLGYLIAPASLQDRLSSLRRATDLCSPPLLQRALAKFLQDGGARRHLRRVIPIYRMRRDALLSALARTMPEGVTWTQPQGGLCVWLTLPPDGAFSDLHHAAIQHGFAFSPGEVFMSAPQPGRHLRICFGETGPETIHAAVEVLATLIRARQSTSLHAAPANWRPLV